MNKKIRIKIQYPWWGNANINNRSWVGIFLDNGNNGEVIGAAYDYGTRKQLVKQCKEEGYLYRVLRHHRKERGKITILESNY